MNASIITECGRKIGFGHLMRCISLCQAFREKEITLELIINSDDNNRDLLKNINYRVFNWLKEKNRVLKLTANADIVVVDSYLADFSFYKTLSDSVKVPVYIDDNARFGYPRGIVVNGSVYAEELGYPEDKKRVYLLGTSYTPLRKEFWRSPLKKIRRNIKSAMITLGGNDSVNMTSKILKRLADKYPELVKNVVIGRGFMNCDWIKEFKDEKTNLIFYPDDAGMKKTMLESDIAISAGGQTTYELARIGVPAVGICFAENQRRNLEKWKEEGFLEYIGWYNDADLADRLLFAVNKLHSWDLRSKMSDIGRKCLDGQGSKRIAEKIFSYANSN